MCYSFEASVRRPFRIDRPLKDNCLALVGHCGLSCRTCNKDLSHSTQRANRESVLSQVARGIERVKGALPHLYQLAQVL